MRINDWKDYICRCSGQLLDLPALEKLAELQEKHFYHLEVTPPKTEESCLKLKNQGFIYLAQKQVFYKKFFTKSERDFAELKLLDYGFIIITP